MSNRRDFLKQIAGGAALAGLSWDPIEVLARNEMEKITILHTNDVHSRIDPFPSNDPKWAGLGGVARRSALIRKIRAEVKNVLLLDSGDFFQGTPYFNIYGGEVELKMMSEMGYDAATLGNHDFDHGVDELARQLTHASFPIINSNYDFSDSPLDLKTVRSKIFVKAGIKIGVFGLGIELNGLVDSKLCANTRYNDPIEKAAFYAHHLKQEMKCDIVICLSHLGYRYNEEKISDQVLAKQSLNIDLILGGHTHTFLDQPVRFRNRHGKEILIAQVGWGGIKLGRIDFYVQKNSRRKEAIGSTVKVSEKSIA